MEIINFAKETIGRYFPSNRKFTSWGDDNILPNRLQEFYDTIPEHSSCIDFIVNSLTTSASGCLLEVVLVHRQQFC